jgi:hypothetical protein
MHLNLLPSEILAEQVIERKSRRWGLVLLLVIVLGAMLCFEQFEQNRCQQVALDAIRAQTNEIRQVVTDTNRFEKELADLRAEISKAEEAKRSRHTLTLVEIVSQCARSVTGQIQVRQLIVQPVAANVNAGKPAGSPASSPVLVIAVGEVTVDGVAESGPAIAEFIESARATGVFSSVVLKSSSAALAHGGGVARQFQIVAQY